MKTTLLTKIIWFTFIGSLWISEAQAFTLPCDSPDYYNPNRLRFENYTYEQGIRTVQLHREGAPMSMPVLELNGKQKLMLSFDDLMGNLRNFRYTFIHCDANWKPSQAQPQGYLSGFTDDQITGYELSRNTRIPYIHYFLLFPTENMNITRSGNYLLKVWEENKPEKLILTQRFYVYEPLFSIQADVKPANSVDDKNYKQELSLSVNSNQILVREPFKDVFIRIIQNGRWDNALEGLQPIYVKDRLFEYRKTGYLVFDGNNEFRHFDTRNLFAGNAWQDSISIDRIGQIHIFLKPQTKRTFLKYITDNDINGQFLVKNSASTNDNTESDYVWVHFFLNYPVPFTDGAVYVSGALTNWNFSEENKMKYNFSRKTYECSLLLKQGFYDYSFVVLKNGAKSAEARTLEGNHSETENDYTIWVYYSEPGNFMTRLVAISKINSRQAP